MASGTSMSMGRISSPAAGELDDAPSTGIESSPGPDKGALAGIESCFSWPDLYFFYLLVVITGVGQWKVGGSRGLAERPVRINYF